MNSPKFLQRFLFGIPGKRGSELVTRDLVRPPNPSDIVGSVLGRHMRGGNQVVVKGVIKQNVIITRLSDSNSPACLLPQDRCLKPSRT